MVNENFKVWLIEVNASPDMSHSTEVTGSGCHDVASVSPHFHARVASLVQQVSEDILKVVIDRKVDKTADTGSVFCVFGSHEAESCIHGFFFNQGL